MKKSKIFFSIVFVLFLLEIFLFSPTFNSDIFIQTIKNAFTWNIDQLDLSIICVFNTMGIIPLLLGCYLIPQTENFKPTVLPFWFLSFAFGAGAILPYLILRQDQSNPIYLSNKLQTLLKSSLTRYGFMFLVVLLISLGFGLGSYENYFTAFHNSKLIHVMTVDLFILVLLILPYLIFTESSN